MSVNIKSQGWFNKGAFDTLSKHGINLKTNQSLETETVEKSKNIDLTLQSRCLDSKQKVKLTTIFKFLISRSDKSIDGILARMVATDNISFSKFVTSVDLRYLFSSCGRELPSSATTIQQKVMKYYQKNTCASYYRNPKIYNSKQEI